jgi:hypothetical protein
MDWSDALRDAIDAYERGDRIGDVPEKEADGRCDYAGIPSA